jgi:hypothetical protein
MHRAKTQVREWTTKQIETLDGLVLSDGSLTRRLKYRPRMDGIFRLSSSEKEFCVAVMAELPSGLFAPGNPYPTKGGWLIESRSDPFLTLKYNQWYVDGTKTLYKGVKLSKVTCYWWYIGDGTNRHTGKFQGQLCTDCFTEQEVRGLVRRLVGMGLSCRFHWHNTGLGRMYPRILFYKQELKRFLSYVGPCGLDCYKYKWEVS